MTHINKQGVINLKNNTSDIVEIEVHVQIHHKTKGYRQIHTILHITQNINTLPPRLHEPLDPFA